ncbi:unnamed protein product [Plutella xylostella]|uniref:(diamondback moth) hypothetical protein n=1 Tax=Plutella xylostella TaxID=51655 RepID=A0A8S4FGW8_PLUXY|nr:unnamed protein product [Plutella xylostella]
MHRILDRVKFCWCKTNRWHRALFLLIIAELKWIPGNRLGFECNDPSLSHPYTGDTISWKWLIAVTALLPLALMLVVEKIFHKSDDRKASTKRALKWSKEYLFGLLVNLVFVSILKVLVGEPRPHFFDTCGPKEADTCEGSEFVPRYTCTKQGWVAQSDRSFPSGHTSMAVHAALFVAWYLHRRLTLPSHTLTVRSLQATSVLSGAACAVSRVLDRRHHWRDVLAGAGIAVVGLQFTIFRLCKNFECPRETELKNGIDDKKINETGESPTALHDNANM